MRELPAVLPTFPLVVADTRSVALHLADDLLHRVLDRGIHVLALLFSAETERAVGQELHVRAVEMLLDAQRDAPFASSFDQVGQLIDLFLGELSDWIARLDVAESHGTLHAHSP